jgi:hypothetical protein
MDIIDFGGERGTRTLDLGIMRSDFKHKSLLIQLLDDEILDRAPVLVRIYPDDSSYVRTKSDTVDLQDVLQLDGLMKTNSACTSTAN